MVPEYPGLRPLVPEDYPWVAGRLAQGASPICDLTPANLFIWRDCERPSVTLVGDSLCIQVEPHSEPAYFLEPVGGSGWLEAVRVCLSHAGRISRAGTALASRLAGQDFRIAPLRDHFDYVYGTEVLATLKGKRFDGKRNQIRRFAASCPDFEFHPLEPEHLAAAAGLFEKWTRMREDGGGEARAASFSHECQRRALDKAFSDFGRLGLSGGALMVRGEMQGFVVATAGYGETAVVHFQYANTEFPGIYQTLLHEACVRLFPHCPLVNLEEDLGVPGLRKTKLSYQPLRLEEKFEILPARDRA